MDQVEEDLKRLKIVGCRAKIEDRTDQDPPRFVESIEEEEEEEDI